MLLYREVIERLDPDAVQFGTKVTGYERAAAGVRVALSNGEVIPARILIGADGIHSKVRGRYARMMPPSTGGGMILWRGTLRTKPLRTGSSFVGLGTHQLGMVIYPISPPDADRNALINWITEITVDNQEGWQQDGWFREVPFESFAHYFDSFKYDWLNVPDMLAQADCASENPMIDRDPVPTWVGGPVALLGDAAYAMYPRGSNGAR